MFLGEYKHSIDNKCRLTIPAKFREELNNRCVIAKGLDGCLTVYPLDEWALVCEKIDAKPSSDPKVRRFKRLFYASASVEDLDPADAHGPCSDREGRLHRWRIQYVRALECRTLDRPASCG